MKDTFLNLSIEKQEMIVAGAFQEFASYGYKEASTNRLVKTLGISKGSLFKYFDSKLDLYDYLLDLALDDLLTYLEKFQGHGSTYSELILEFAALEFDFLIEKPEKYLFFYHLQTQLALEELETISDKLIALASDYNRVLLDRLGLPNKQILRDHLSLIIAAYNRQFMSGVKVHTDCKELKQTYLDGLAQHLNLIRWD